MARRRTRAEVGDHDSVLDTMTNVVGILVIVAAVTQINVGSAVGRAQATLGVPREAIDHPAVPPEELATAQRERDAVGRELGELREAAARGEAERALTDAEWADLARRVRAAAAPGQSAAELRRELEQLERQGSEDEAEAVRLGERIVRSTSRVEVLKQEIEILRGRKAPAVPAARMRLPDPSPRGTEEREVVPFVAQEGKVFVWDRRSVIARWERDRDEGFASIPPSLGSTESKLEWLAARWNRADYGNGTLRLRFRVVRDADTAIGWDLVMIEELVPGAPGATLPQIQGGDSAFHRALKGLRPETHWVFFRAYDDSFESYVAARAHAEDLGFDVGWVPYGPGQPMARSLVNSTGGRPVVPD